MHDRNSSCCRTSESIMSMGRLTVTLESISICYADLPGAFVAEGKLPSRTAGRHFPPSIPSLSTLVQHLFRAVRPQVVDESVLASTSNSCRLRPFSGGLAQASAHARMHLGPTSPAEVFSRTKAKTSM